MLCVFVCVRWCWCRAVFLLWAKCCWGCGIMIVPIDRVGIVDYRTVKQKCYTHAVIELETFPSIVHTFSWFALFFGFSWFCWFIGLVFNCYRNKAKTGHSTTLCCFLLPHFNRSLGLLLTSLPHTHTLSLTLYHITKVFLLFSIVQYTYELVLLNVSIFRVQKNSKLTIIPTLCSVATWWLFHIYTK